MIELDVVLVCMNNEKEVFKTLNSLNSISDLNPRFIIVDSSSDEDIIKALRKSKYFFSCVYDWTPPKGIYAAMNRGIEIAGSGNYVWFLNPGDVLSYEGPLRELVSNLSNRQATWGFTQAIYNGPNGKIFPQKLGTARSLLEGKWSLSHQAMLVPKELLNDVGNFDAKFRISADLNMQYSLLKFHEFVYLPQPTVSIDTSGISHTNLMRTYWESHLVRLRSQEFSYPKSYIIFSFLVTKRLIKSILNRLRFGQGLK